MLLYYCLFVKNGSTFSTEASIVYNGFYSVQYIWLRGQYSSQLSQCFIKECTWHLHYTLDCTAQQSVNDPTEMVLNEFPTIVQSYVFLDLLIVFEHITSLHCIAPVVLCSTAFLLYVFSTPFYWKDGLYNI